MKININIEKIVFPEHLRSTHQNKQLLLKGIEENIRNSLLGDKHDHPDEKHIDKILISNPSKTDPLNVQILARTVGENILRTLK